MNKTELVAMVAEKANLTKKDSEAAIEATMEAIIEAVANGDKVQLIGFGTFKANDRAERLGHNPMTKETIVIPAAKVPSFKAGKAFKDAVAK